MPILQGVQGTVDMALSSLGWLTQGESLTGWTLSQRSILTL